MGLLRDIFEEKVKIWEGPDEEVYDRYCKELRSAGIKIQAFIVNQKRPKCTGNCASCMEHLETYKTAEGEKIKLGAGCSDDLLTAGKPYDLYTIFVKKSEEQKCLDMLGLPPWPKEDADDAQADERGN